MTRDFTDHALGDGAPIDVLVADGGGELRIDAVNRVGVPDDFDDTVDRELIHAIDARDGVDVVVHAPGDRRLVISSSLPDTADAEIGIAYIRSLLPTLVELSARGVLMIVFAGIGVRELNAIADGRAQADREMQADDNEHNRRARAALRTVQWSSGQLDRVLGTRIPTFLRTLRAQRRRLVTIPLGAASAPSPRDEAKAPEAAPVQKPDAAAQRYLWTVMVGTLHLSYWSRPARPEDVARLHEEVARASESAQAPMDLLVSVAAGTGLSPSAARTRAAVMISELETKIDSVAIVLPGSGLWALAIRGMFRAIGVLVQTPIHWRAFARTDVAASWLEKRRIDRLLEAPQAAAILVALGLLELQASTDEQAPR